MSNELERFPSSWTPVEQENLRPNMGRAFKPPPIGSEETPVEGAHHVDFRFLPAIRAAMTYERPAIPPSLKKKKRRGLRRVMRELARPFEQVSRALRNRAGFIHRIGLRKPPTAYAAVHQESGSAQIAQLQAAIEDLQDTQLRMLPRFKARSHRPRPPRPSPGARSGRAAHADDIAAVRRSIGAVQELQATALRRAKRQPIPVAGDRLLFDLDDRYVAVPSSDIALVTLLLDEPVYEAGVSTVLRQLAAGKSHVIDVGASIGLHSITMARAMRPNGRLLALEPVPRTFEALAASLDLNGLASRVDAHQLAAGERAGEMLLHCHTISRQNSRFAYPGIATKQISVPVAPLDALVPAGTTVDLIRIDAEGAEFDVLKGMTRILSEAPQIAAVLKFSTTHYEKAGGSPPELVDFMASFGLAPQRIDDQTGHLEAFDLHDVLARPAANVLFQRAGESPRAAGGIEG